MSPSERGQAPTNYSSFHIQYRHALITEFGVDVGVVDGYLLPRRIPQLYEMWRHLRTRDNPLEVARSFARKTVEESEDINAKATQEEAASEISRILREVYGPVIEREARAAAQDRENYRRLQAGEVSAESREKKQDSTGGDL